MHATSLLFLALTFPSTTHACGSIGPPGPTGTVLQRKMGPLIREFGKIPDRGDGDTATTASQLSCSSADRADCCWRQGRSGPIDWVTAGGIADPGLMNTYFQQAPPTGVGFIAAYANAAQAGEAVLESCTIPCVDGGDLSLSVDSWQSDRTNLQACVSPADYFAPQNCVPLPKGRGTANLIPLNEPMRLVLIAGDFSEPTGSVVALDNLNVAGAISSDPNCNNEVTTAPPTSGTVEPIEACRATTCSFDSGDRCSYQTLSGGTWDITTGRTGNANTGVRRAAPGSEPYYAGTVVRPNSKAVMESGPINVDGAMELQFQVFEATQDMQVRACINDESNCPWRSNEKVQASDIRWQRASIPIDPNTRKILFVADNQGRQNGAAGIDDIRLFTNAGSEVNC